MKRELEMILERDVLPTTVPEFPMVRRMTLLLNSPLVIPSLHARATVEKQQKEFTDGRDPLFIGYSAAVYFHTCEIKINSWTTQAKKMRGSMLPKFEVKDEMRFTTRKYRAPYGLKELELKQEDKKLDAAGPLYVALTEYKKLDPTKSSPLLVGSPGDKRSNPVENRFRDALEKKQAESEEGESMDETLSEAGEEMEVGNTLEQDPVERNFTTQELLQDLSGYDWANTATPPLGSPCKDLDLPLTNETSNMGMKLLNAKESKRNAFEGNKWMFLNTLDEEAWRDFLR